MNLRSFIPKSRARGIACLILVIFILFIFKLFTIQVVQHEKYVAEADSEHIKQSTLHAKRGEIYALDGKNPVKLVMNETVYTVWADPTQIGNDKQKIIDSLNKIAGGNVRRDFYKYLDLDKTKYQVLASKVSLKQAEMLKKLNLAGVGFDAVSQRVYPEGQLASQVLGFVDASGVGRYGFEQANNTKLSGVNGMLKTVTDIRDIPLTVSDKNVKKPAVNGTNYVLTIDRNIQTKTEQALLNGMKKSGAENGSVVIMNPNNGNVLAMANYPTYNPGEINKVTDLAQLNNDTISVPYEPGSDIKTFTVSAGIDKGVITPESTYNNTGQITVEDRVINNASKNASITGNITMQTALNWSLNTGMVTIAQRLGDGSNITLNARNTMYDYFYNRFRLGQKTGIELANEQAGVVISPSSTDGGSVRYSNMAFGQGMDATMLQVASGFSSVVNGGNYYKPTIIAGEVNNLGVFTKTNKPLLLGQVISNSTSDTVREMVHQAHYATYNPHDGSDKYFIGGKTGTSQTIINGKYVSNQTIGTYLGFGGADSSQIDYVMMVEISGKGMYMSGGVDAKPIFNDISNWLINYYGLTPK